MQQGISFENLPTLLFEKLIDFLRNLVNNYNLSDIHEYTRFMHEHLLFTLLGFVIAPQNTVVFAAGDGIVLINEDIYLREQDNTPTYIGYHLIEQCYLQASPSPLPSTFDLYHVPSDILKRMAIGSDAWLSERALLDQIWGMKTPVSLQLQMNRWSNARHLKDDASLIVAELEPENETGNNGENGRQESGR